MCHLVLALPFLALPVLWLLPPEVSVSLYGAVVAISAMVYILAVRAMRMPVSTGTEALLHAIGTVRSAEGRTVTVWIQSELWSAESRDEGLVEGDRVEVLAVDGLTLKVHRLEARDARTPPRAGQSRLTRVQDTSRKEAS